VVLQPAIGSGDTAAAAGAFRTTFLVAFALAAAALVPAFLLPASARRWFDRDRYVESNRLKKER
jgi:Na+-driven multidrug efflux pump